jgi:hypothetical protein
VHHNGSRMPDHDSGDAVEEGSSGLAQPASAGAPFKPIGVSGQVNPCRVSPVTKPSIA